MMCCVCVCLILFVWCCVLFAIIALHCSYFCVLCVVLVLCERFLLSWPVVICLLVANVGCRCALCSCCVICCDFVCWVRYVVLVCFVFCIHANDVMGVMRVCFCVVMVVCVCFVILNLHCLCVACACCVCVLFVCCCVMICVAFCVVMCALFTQIVW